MARRIQTALARWDTDSDPSNPGWVVDVVHLTGDTETYAAAPDVYHAGAETDPESVVEATLRWEGLALQADEP